MRPIISIVGKSGSGKTTLLEKLIAELKQRGHRVAMVKHTHHLGDLDTPGKDTWKFTRAGSELTALNSPDNLAIYRRTTQHFDPREISDRVLWDYDLILTEGFKSGPYPMIEVHRREQGEDLVTDPARLLAVVSDAPLDVAVPQFSADEVAGIADLIEGVLARDEDALDLVVNGSGVPVSPSLRDLLTRTLAAMIPVPPQDGGLDSLHIALRRKN